MQLTNLQREVLFQLYRHPSGRPFREDAEMAAIDALCRTVPPLVCDPHLTGDALFTRITEHGRTAVLDDPVFLERMSDRELFEARARLED